MSKVIIKDDERMKMMMEEYNVTMPQLINLVSQWQCLSQEQRRKMMDETMPKDCIVD